MTEGTLVPVELIRILLFSQYRYYHPMYIGENKGSDHTGKPLQLITNSARVRFGDGSQLTRNRAIFL
jgi:hypothetical protein